MLLALILKIPIRFINFSIFFLPNFTKCSGLLYFGYISFVTLLTFKSVHCAAFDDSGSVQLVWFKGIKVVG